MLLFALTIASLTAFPQLIAEKRMGAAYQGVHPVVIDDQLYYLVRAHETLDGHPTLGNPYLAEYKNVPGVQFWIPDMVLAYVSMLFGGLHAGALVFDFVFPFLLILLSYAILFILTRDQLLSVAFAAFLDPGLFFAVFLRTPNPQLFVVLLAAFLCLVLALTYKSRRWAIATTVLGGSLFYIYPFYWTYWVVIVAVACVLSYLFVRETRAHRMFAAVLSGTLLLGIPYFVQTYQAAQMPDYAESLQRIGVIATHFPSGIIILSYVAITLALMGWCWWKRILPLTPLFVFVASAALAGAIVVNQHVITGSNFYFAGHYTLFVQWMSVFGIAWCLSALLKRYVPETNSAPARWGLALLLLLFASSRVIAPVSSLAAPHAADIAAQRYGPVLAWLDAHTKTDDVVYANQMLSPYIPAYTRDNVFYSPWADVSYLPQSEVESRFIAVRYFDPAFTRETITDAEIDVLGAQYLGAYQHTAMINKVRKLFGLTPLQIERRPEAVIQRLLAEARSVRAGTFQHALQGRRVDYLAWDTIADPAWRVPQTPGLTRLYEANGIAVYAVSNSR